MKTEKQLKEMYRDLMGCKCLAIDAEDVLMFVDYCREKHGLIVNGGAITDNGKRQYVYID